MSSTENAASRPVAIVTAASKGMGEACARELARRGYRLALLARSDDIASLASKLDALHVVGSVTEPDDLASLVVATMQAFGRIDVVVNNTGHPPRGELLGISDEEWHSALDLLVMNVIRMARLVTPIMLAAKAGSIVNISTIGVLQPDLNHPVSAVLRAGLGSFAKLYAQRYAAGGLRMNNVLPGRIASWPQPEERIREIPAARLGTVEEIAAMVAFLASDEARYINGQSMVVDGGLVRGI
jgi:NAD(P)-dependent dehydrogenase (short-subunit alcohol dehydrogenase family)